MIQEEGQVGAPVCWSIPCDREGRPGSLSFGFASRVGADSRHFSCVAAEEVYRDSGCGFAPGLGESALFNETLISRVWDLFKGPYGRHLYPAVHREKP